MNSGMVSTGAPIAPIASTNLSLKIKNSYDKLKNKTKEKKEK
jgi:hypothetical protein